MKKLLILLLIVLYSQSFAQDFKDKIITLKNDTIKCQITLVNDNNIFFRGIQRNKKNIRSLFIPVTQVKNYILDKDSKPEILTKNEINTAQTQITYSKVDSLKIFDLRLKQLEDQTKKIQLNLTYCHNQFKTGTTITVLGIGAEVLGSVLLLTDPDSQIPAQILMLGGSITVLVGSIIQIDSHRFIGKAGIK